MVNAAQDFVDSPTVINGYSELMKQVTPKTDLKFKTATGLGD